MLNNQISPYIKENIFIIVNHFTIKATKLSSQRMFNFKIEYFPKQYFLL